MKNNDFIDSNETAAELTERFNIMEENFGVFTNVSRSEKAYYLHEDYPIAEKAYEELLVTFSTILIILEKEQEASEVLKKGIKHCEIMKFDSA